MTVNTGASPTDVTNNFYPGVSFSVSATSTINFITLALLERTTTPSADLNVFIRGSLASFPNGPDAAQTFYTGTVAASSLSVGTSTNVTLSPSSLILGPGQYWITLKPTATLTSTPGIGTGSYQWSAAGISAFGIALDFGSGFQIFTNGASPAYLVDATAVTSGVPEPSSFALLLLPLAAAFRLRRKN